MTAPIRVLIIDDHRLVRKGIRALLAEEADIEVVGEAGDGVSAVAEAVRLQPDVLLMDLVMPTMDGIEAIRRINGAMPPARILVLTSFAEDDKLYPAIRAGALGYLLKDSEPEDLIAAIRDIYHGVVPLHPDVARKLLADVAHTHEAVLPAEALTEREVQVLQLASRGCSNQDIATNLQISEATVRTHMRNILGKLHLASRTQAVLYALREGLASLDATGDSAESF